MLVAVAIVADAIAFMITHLSSVWKWGLDVNRLFTFNTFSLIIINYVFLMKPFNWMVNLIKIIY